MPRFNLFLFFYWFFNSSFFFNNRFFLNRFVPNITFGMDMIKALRKYTNGILDVHLMIIKPEKYIPQFIAAGADVITFHPDASDDVVGALKTIKDAGKKCGLVLNPDKPDKMLGATLTLLISFPPFLIQFVV